MGKWIIQRADHVVCISLAGEKWVKAEFSRSYNISTVYRGFLFPEITRSTNATPKIGFVGRLTGLKNIPLLINTLAEIRHQSWTCEIVGS